MDKEDMQRIRNNLRMIGLLGDMEGQIALVMKLYDREILNANQCKLLLEEAYEKIMGGLHTIKSS